MSLLAPVRAPLLPALVRLLSVDPVDVVARARERAVENGVAPVVLFFVAVIVLLALAAAMSVAVLIFCSQKGMNFEWYAKTSLFEVQIACKR